MKRIAIALVISLVAVFLLGTTVLAADPPDPEEPIVVDIVILGDDPTVTVEADGDNATIYINGQDIQEPTVKVESYRIENPYNDAKLKVAISDLTGLLESTGLDVSVISNGLAKVILVIGEHTDNLRELLGIVTQTAEDSITRDNELVAQGEDQDEVMLRLGAEFDTLGVSLSDLEEEYRVLEEEHRVSVADTAIKIEELRGELRSDYTTKLAVTWGVLGAAFLLLLFWMVWRIRLARS